MTNEGEQKKVEGEDDGKAAMAAGQIIGVAGVLGGLTFTALVFVLQATSTFEKPQWGEWGWAYFTILSAMIAAASILFIFSSIFAVPVAIGRRSGKEPLGKFPGDVFILSFFALLIILPLLLLAVDWASALTTAVLETVLILYSQGHLSR